MVDVVAEIIEPKELLKASFTPAKIEADFETLEKEIDRKVSPYRGIVIDVENEKEANAAAKFRTELNNIAKDLESRDRVTKAKYMAPYLAFHKKLKEIEEIAKSEADALGEQIAESKRIHKEKKRSKLEEFYTEYAPALVPNVPYSKIHDDRWLLKGTEIVVAEAEIAEKVEKVASDWESLKSLKLKFADACEVKFFDTLDLGEAVAYNDKLISDGKRIAAMKQEVEKNISAEQVEEKPIGGEPEEKRHYVIVLEAVTDSQIREAGRILDSVGIHGTLKVGTLAEVCAREKEAMPYAV